jgi:hypothetical protein
MFKKMHRITRKHIKLHVQKYPKLQCLVEYM